MNILLLAVLSVLCALTQAISFTTIAKVSLVMLSLNKPVSCFFGMFRRRKSPPIQETVMPTEAPFRFPNQPFSGGFNPFGGLGAGGPFFPGFNPFGFGMSNPSNRFPPQFKPPTPMRMPQKPQMPAQSMFPPQQPAMQNFPPQQHTMQQFPHQSMQQFQQHQAMQQFPHQQMPLADMPQDMKDTDFDFSEEEGTPGMNTEEAESFFTLLAETDESKCISRLVCEMGANPESGGEFGQTIVEIIGNLKDFSEGSKVSEYNEVLNLGVAEGMSACFNKFSMCDEESYQMVKKAQLEDGGNE